MHSKLTLTLLLTFASFPLLAQDTGLLIGKVSDNNGVVSYASITVKGFPFLGAVTNEKGEFQLDNIPAGEHDFSVACIGYKSVQKKLTIATGKPSELNILLEEDLLWLEGVVVSANRHEVNRFEAPVIINTIDSRIFEASQSLSLSEGLNFQPGLRLEANCQNCGFTQVRMNGMEGPYTQILINSRPVFSGLNGVYGLEQIPTNMIERVEVVKGGGSALYGGNAIAGTINIITKEPDDNSFQLSTNYALIDGETPDRAINVNGSVVSQDRKKGLVIYGMNRNRDYYDANGDGISEITTLENTTFGLNTYYKTSDLSKLSLDFYAINEERRGGDNFQNPAHQTNITEQIGHKVIGGGLTYEMYSKDLKNNFSIYLSGQNTDRASYYGGGGLSDNPEDVQAAANAYGTTDDYTLVGGLQYSRTLGKSLLVAGYEMTDNHLEDRMPGYNRFISQSVTNHGLYLQYELPFARKGKAVVGGRIDKNSLVDNPVINPRVSVLYDLTKDLQWRVSYAKGFRGPQIFDEDLHISIVGGEGQVIRLADDLRMERSNNFTSSFTLNKTIKSTQVSLVVEGFYTHLEDAFILEEEPTEENVMLMIRRNGGGAVVQGVNLEARVSPSSNYNFQGGLTYQSNKYDEAVNWSDTEGVPPSSQILRTPNLYGYFTSIWSPISALKVSLTGVYTGEMYVPHFATEGNIDNDVLELTDPFFDAGIKAAYHFKIDDDFFFEVNGGVQNVLNSYQSDFDSGDTRDSGYIYGPLRPITYFLGLKISTSHL